ncbi:MAG: hypothetical protein M1827_005287 [Pycnora praestabilis]|nr:MAG: hypothetical protein M1827_005287 [Pycnora praestabilis]
MASSVIDNPQPPTTDGQQSDTTESLPSPSPNNVPQTLSNRKARANGGIAEGRKVGNRAVGREKGKGEDEEEEKSSLKIHIELDLYVEVELKAYLQGDITIGLL